MMRREEATIGRQKISYLISEPATGSTRQRPVRNVVFLHAFPLQAAMWEQTLGAVPDGWRAIAPDLRGFGESSLPAGSHGMSAMAGDVVDLLDHLRIEHAAIVGCSMGGYILFELMSTAPRYVSALGLVSTRPGADSEEGRRNRQKMIEQTDSEGVAAVAAQMPAKLVGATTQADRPDLMKRLRTLIEGNTREGIKAAISAMMNRVDSTPVLGAITAPTLVIAGKEDALIPPSEAEAMHRSIPNAECEVIPFAGHLPNLEQPAPFDGRLWPFLQKL
jgi:pimeloyl-ACP methyl ester carboxylesterase